MMTRKERRDLLAIVRDYLGRGPYTGAALTEDGTCVGARGGAHDEGYSMTYVEAWAESPGVYGVVVHTDGRDCDGRHSSTDEYRVRRLSRSRRYYPWSSWSWETGKPVRARGRHEVKRWAWDRVTGRQRDYSAERAGY